MLVLQVNHGGSEHMTGGLHSGVRLTGDGGLAVVWLALSKLSDPDQACLPKNQGGLRGCTGSARMPGRMAWARGILAFCA